MDPVKEEQVEKNQTGAGARDQIKRRRQEKILELVGTREIERQAQLCELLTQAGFSVTQTTVSRDIRELHLTKVPGQQVRAKYAQQTPITRGNADRYIRVLREAYLSLEQAGNLVVLKTASGMAGAAAAALDALQVPGIVGSIAGDDTIFAATRSEAEAASVLQELRGILE